MVLTRPPSPGDADALLAKELVECSRDRPGLVEMWDVPDVRDHDDVRRSASRRRELRRSNLRHNAASGRATGRLVGSGACQVRFLKRDPKSSSSSA